MEETKIIARIDQLCQIRGWSYYRLAKESGIPYSTLCTMLHKANSPSFATLTRLCEGFGITLGEFFDTENQRSELTPQERELLALWGKLNRQQKASVQQYMEFLLTVKTAP